MDHCRLCRDASGRRSSDARSVLAVNWNAVSRSCTFYRSWRSNLRPVISTCRDHHISGESDKFIGSSVQRRNFLCDGGDMSPPLLKVVVTVTTTFSRAIWIFSHTVSLLKRTPEGRKLYVVNVENLCTDFYVVLSKPFRFRGHRPPDPHHGLCPSWTPLGALPPDPRYRLALHALAICPDPCHHHVLIGVKLRRCVCSKLT